ncbi:hypothetical protein [Sphingosinicella sp. CPCC 101087]|uniref:hypothetical protein n=1 Tax=Sphingosinicella sp. CPCC 101087 TaxID=2497754 RepID=UPI00101C4772|nr:hypothetical protein [Sphingosinicella sp. CPCC 101087]
MTSDRGLDPWTAAVKGRGAGIGATLLTALLLSTAACAQPNDSGVIRNERTREAARACGLFEDAVSIDPIQATDRQTLVIPKHTADRSPETWACLQRWAESNGYNMAYQLVFN